MRWDAIVIGTGMGGATIGYALAKAGRRVLFCEKGLGSTGPDSGREVAGLRGDYPENLMRTEAQRGADPRSILRRAGRAADAIDDVSFGAPRTFVPFIGSGVGGSSALYGMALERFAPADFAPRRNHPDADADLPERWPVGFPELLPYYAEAEQLYGVRRPAARDASGLAPPNGELWRHLQSTGLHPYALPLANVTGTGCTGCQGFLCAHGCKNHGGNVCIDPAVARHGAHVLADCTVTRLVCDGDRVAGVDCVVGGRAMRLQGDTVLLAAGALATPALLLGSASDAWPTGLANRSGLVGRYLMRHCIDLYAIAVDTPIDPHVSLKEMAFNDFYATDAAKLGSVQSFGAMPPPRMLVDSMQEELADEAGQVVGTLFGAAKPLLRPVLKRLFANRVILAAVMEDLPYATNRVTVTPTDRGPRTNFHYRLPAYDRARVTLFRESMKKALSPYRYLLLKQAENNRRLAHVCGTCRFGDDPDHSVLDRDNKAHDLANLYVVDASFFPSSGGTNPALTVAANALRVADAILGAAPRRTADVAPSMQGHPS